MKYDYMRAVQELKVAMSVEDIHVVLENCTKIALEYLNRGEGFHISPKNCKRKRDWQSQVFMELKRIFQCIEEGHEIVSRRVGIYDAEHDTFQMAEGVGEITTAWIERYKAERERMWAEQAKAVLFSPTSEEDPEMVAIRAEHEILKKIGAYIDAHIHEPAHRVEPYAEYADETYSDDGGDNSRPEQDIPDNHTQEDNTMTRKTVSEAVIAVKGATTVEANRDALMACTVKNKDKPERIIICNPPTPPAPEPEINPDDTNEVEYELLQLSIDDSMEERTALKKAMNLLDPKSRDYSVLYGLYCRAGNEIEECIERRRVIHKAITALEEVRVRAERQSAVA